MKDALCVIMNKLKIKGRCTLCHPQFRNFKLLSFGDEAEEEEEEVLAATKNFSTKGNSAHDIAMDPTLSASTGKTLHNGTDSLERLV